MMLEPPALEKAVLVVVDRVVFVSRPVKCSTDAEHIVPSLPKCMSTDHALFSCILSCGPIVPAHPCLTDAFKASKDFSDQAPPLSSQLLHTRPSGHFTSNFRLLFQQNHKAACGKYDGLIQRG